MFAYNTTPDWALNTFKYYEKMKCRTVVLVILALTVTLIIPYDNPMLYGVFLFAYVGRILWEKCICYMSGALLPNILDPTNVIIVNDEKTCEKVINQILLKIKNYKVIGFDCEGPKGLPERPIALLQLATSDGLCVLIRLCKFYYIPRTLVDLLKDKSVVKVGSAVTSDSKRLCNDYNIRVSGCLNIDLIARLHNFEGASLNRIAESVLGIHLNKHWTIQSNSWEQHELTDAQIKYAALNSFLPVKILEKINQQRINKVNLREREAQKQLLCYRMVIH